MSDSNDVIHNTINCEKPKLPECGIIMPIAKIGSCDEQHWQEVKDILFEVIEKTGLEPVPVWINSESDIIQNKIISNLYSQPIAICDVSCKNPNVMFELGIRLAFNKPTIVIKDDLTNYSFDTSPIEHLLYPQDLRYSAIVKFKEDLEKRIKNLYEQTKDNKSYKTFLSNFGEIVPSEIDEKQVPATKFIMEQIEDIKRMINSMWFNPDNSNIVYKYDYSKINLTPDEIVEKLYISLANNNPNFINLDLGKQRNTIGEELFNKYGLSTTKDVLTDILIELNKRYSNKSSY